MTDRPSVAVVGGGLLGLAAGYRLASAGVAVTVFERDPALGGLAGSEQLGGVRVDRFYHAILPTDTRVRGLAAELGLADRFRFRRTGVGFFHDGRLASMSTAGELMRFPGLKAVDRARLAAFIAYCQVKRSHDDLDDVPLDRWLRSTCGKRLWERLWRPLLDSKFDGCHADLPATYLWSRTRRMSRTRDRSSREVLGALDGGYQALADALGEAIAASGGEVLTRTPVHRIPAAGGGAAGVVTDAGFRSFDLVLTTQLPPAARRLLAPELAAALGPDRCRYLGVVCLVMRVRRSVSPFYALNITDRRVPLTTVVETTHVVDPEWARGSLVYVPRYVRPDSPELERPSAEIRREYLGHVRTIFPGLREDDVIAAHVARARVAEPVHVVGSGPRTGPVFPAPGLAVASSADVYPEIVNGQAILGVAERTARRIVERLGHSGVRRAAA